MSGHVIPANGTPVLATIYGPDAMSQQIANAMAIATSTISPMSAGRHTSGTSRGSSGDPGYGVNRFAGRLNYQVQGFAGAAVAAVQNPKSKRLGFGAGPSGQPGLPNTGTDAGGVSPLAWMGYDSMHSFGMGS
jgi:hypothetical protein